MSFWVVKATKIHVLLSPFLRVDHMHVSHCKWASDQGRLHLSTLGDDDPVF